MGEETEHLNILYIEDNEQDYRRLQRDANPYRILLEHETNLEDGIKTFKRREGEKFFDGIILDAWCLEKRDDTVQSETHALCMCHIIT
jgi:hypothetical protein